MKKFVFIALAAIAFTTATQAQDSTTSRKMKMDRPAKMQRAPMFDELNLTQDQKDQMKKLHEDNKAKMEDIKNNASLSDDQKQAQMKTLREEQHKNMESILTDEQKAKMKQLRHEQRKEHKEAKAASDSTMRK